MAYKESKLTDEGDSCNFAVAPIDYKFIRGPKNFKCWYWYERMADLKDEASEVLKIPKTAWKKHGNEWRCVHKEKQYIVILAAKNDNVMYEEQKPKKM